MLDRLKAVDHGDAVAEMTPYCRANDWPAMKHQSLSGPFVKLQNVSLLEGEQQVDRLLIKTDRGFYPTSIVFRREYPGPGCGMSSGYSIDSAIVEAIRPTAPILVVRVTKRAAHLMAGDPSSFEAAAAFLIGCPLDAGGAPVCREEITASFDGDGTWTRQMQDTHVFDVHPAHWDWEREASVDDEGNLRSSPCVGPKGCGRRNVDLLRRF